MASARKKMRVIAVINQKGGVGKTTTSVNLAHALALGGKKILAIDLDPQGNLSTSFGVNDPLIKGLDEVLLDGIDVNNMCLNVRENLDIVPAGKRLGELEFEKKGGADRGFRLRKALTKLAYKPDFIIIDCPPSAGLVGMNGLLAAHELILPVASDFLSMQGLCRMLGIVKHVERMLHFNTKKWLLVTRYQCRRRLAKEVKEKLVQQFPEQVFATSIRETVALAESPSYGKTIFDYKRLSNGGKDYLSLASDILKSKTVTKCNKQEEYEK